MEIKLSENFHNKISSIVEEKIENKNTQSIIKQIDWEKLSLNCFTQIISFFDKVTVQKLKNNDIDEIGAISFNWNQYDGDITIDFSSDNSIETAFDEGYIMANSAIDNDSFFQEYFDCTGEESFETIGDDNYDYNFVIYLFELVLTEILPEIVKTDTFNKLPRKSPCHFGFSAFDDELPEVFYSI
jgi:hypothetical protein